MRARTCIARSLCIGSAASLAFDGYAQLLVEHPLTTNIATAGALAAAGDAVAQRNNVVYDAKRGLSNRTDRAVARKVLFRICPGRL